MIRCDFYDQLDINKNIYPCQEFVSRRGNGNHVYSGDTHALEGDLALSCKVEIAHSL